MFGNIWGWLMSVVIVAFTTAIIIIGGVPGAITKPTKALPAALQSAALGVEPAAVLPPGTESCNAGQAYRDAAAKFSQRDMKKKVKAYLYEKDPKKKKAAAAALHADLEPLLNARNCSKMDLYTSKPEQVLNYENEKPELARLESLGNLLVALGGFYSKDDPPKCRQYMEAALAMGRNLYQERVCFEEYRIGVAVISNSSAQLARFGTDPSDTARVAQLNSLKTEADKALSKAGPTWAGVSGIGTEPDGRLRFTGDMFDIAQHSKEPMWRSEALLKLGRMQHMASVPNAADQKGAKRLTAEVAVDPSAPATVRAAAAAGHDLSVEKFNLYGGGGSNLGPWD